MFGSQKLKENVLLFLVNINLAYEHDSFYVLIFGKLMHTVLLFIYTII